MYKRDLYDAVSLDIIDIVDEKCRKSVSRAIRVEQQRLKDMEIHIDKAKEELEKRVISNKVKYYISLQRMKRRRRSIDFGYEMKEETEHIPYWYKNSNDKV